MKYLYLDQLFETNHTSITNFFLMAGPCVVESEDMVMRTAGRLVQICRDLGLPLIFKSSYRKANRRRMDSFTGIGDEAALKILAKVHEKYGIPVMTDIHAAGDAALAAEYVDVLQIPAFLCRQTDILIAAAATGKIVNVKKGQFLSAESMQFVTDKLEQAGNNHIILTERGTMLGYYDLVVDFRSIPVMQSMNVPVVVDCTHSVQQPNQPGGVTGGDPRMIETIARAGIAVGADGLFIETHPDPAHAKSDSATMLDLALLEPMMERLVALRQLVAGW